MKNIKTIGLCILLALSTSFQACKKNDDLLTKQTEVNVSLNNPQNLENVTITNAIISFKEINSGKVITANKLMDGKLDIKLPEGSYDVSLEGEINYTIDGETKSSQVRGYQEGLVVNGSTATLSLFLFLHNEDANFVIKEIFFTGNKTPEGKTYNGDKYFVIYNNSDKTLYADGLVIAQSTFLTTTKRVYSPDVMANAFTANAIVMIPGGGDDYPILPGKSFVIANNAINHLEYNTNSLDLRNAEFELELLGSINVDNPQVTDLINVSSTLLMHDRGYKSFVLAKFATTPTDFLTQNKYTYSYMIGDREMKGDAYKISNSIIIDAVNLSVTAGFDWIVTDPSLDMGWTYCGQLESDPNRYGKSVIRKVLSTAPDGRKILKDTNNSTVDFNAEVKPSLMK